MRRFKKVHEKIYFTLLLGVVITMPFSIRLNSLCIVLLSINWLLEGNFKQKFIALFNSKYALILCGFYIFMAATMLYTNNIQNGFVDLEKKLSLFVFPLIISSSSPVTSAELNRLLKWFLYACLAAMLICLVNAFITYLQQGTSDSFFYHELGSTLNFHAVYFAFYLSFSIFIAFYFLLKKEGINVTNKILYWAYILFTFLFILLLSSKTVIITMVIFSAVFILFVFYIKRKLLKGVLIMLLANSLIILILSQLPYTRQRFQEVVNSDFSVIKDPEYTDDKTFTGATLRATIWRFAFEILSENKTWISGVGTGDVQDKLNESYYKHGVYLGDPAKDYNEGFLNVNAHNQYLQFFLGLGIIGLCWFIFILLWPLISAARKKNFLFFSWLLLFCIFSFTEATLQTHKGVVFYSFFNSLFAFHMLNNKQDTEV